MQETVLAALRVGDAGVKQASLDSFKSRWWRN